MKKLLTLLTMALIAISANAQAVIAEIDWTQESEYTYWCSGENGSTAVVGAEGLEINVPAAGDNYWNPQTVVLNVPGLPVADNPDAPAFLAEDGRYQVIITAKHPAGQLQVNLGTWDDGLSLQKDFDVAEAADFEDIVVDFSDGWPADCFSNVHVLWQCGALPGLRILKKIQIIDLNVNSNYDTWTIAGDKNLLGSDWDAADKKNYMSTYDGKNYTLTKSTYLSKGTYHFKVYKDNAMQKSYPKKNASLVINEEAFYNVKFTFNSDTKELSATATKKEVLFYNYISKGKVVEVKSIASDFKGELIIPSSVTHEGETYTVTKIGDRSFSNCRGLISVNIPNSVTTIGSYAFSYCSGLKSITIPNSVTTIGMDCFDGCYSLTAVNISDIKSWCSISFDFDKTPLSNPLYYAKHLYLNGEEINNLIIPNGVIVIKDNVFYNCLGLSTVSISNNVTSIGNNAFFGCSGLTSITIPNSVTSIGYYTFSGCSGLTSVTLPNSVTSISGYAFHNCNGLKSISLPSSVTTIGGCAFSGCSGLTSITIPNKVTSIGYGAFSGCSGLTSITIPNSVSSIGENAFYGCNGLKSASIGCGICSINSGAFSNCSGLTDVYCYAEKLTDIDPEWDETEGLYTHSKAFAESYIEYATLHVPKGCSGAYKAVEPWKNFKSILEMVDAKVKLSKTKAAIEKGKTLTLKATITPSDLPDKSLTWESSNTNVASVTSAGKVMGVNAGTATITCTSNSTGVKATCKVTVGYVELDKTEATIMKGKTTTLSATVYPSSLTDKSVTWESSNTKIATVTSAGKVKGVKAGSATITCTSNATGLKATCTVNVVNGIVTLNKTEACVQKGKTMTLKATVTPETLADKSMTWESSDKKIATVTKAGKVKGVKYGTATITCTSVATGAKATCQVTVGKVVVSISEVSIKKSRGITLEATVYPEDLADKSVTWKSSDKSIATVDKEGRVKGIKAGTATITCTSVATGLKGTCTVTVLSNSEARSMIGDDDELTGLKELESSAAAEPFDVYDLSGRKVLHQVTSLDGLSDGIYIVNGKKILKKK